MTQTAYLSTAEGTTEIDGGIKRHHTEQTKYPFTSPFYNLIVFLLVFLQTIRT